MSNTAPSRADPVVVFPLSRWCPPQETSQPHPPHSIIGTLPEMPLSLEKDTLLHHMDSKQLQYHGSPASGSRHNVSHGTVHTSPLDQMLTGPQLSVHILASVWQEPAHLPPVGWNYLFGPHAVKVNEWRKVNETEWAFRITSAVCEQFRTDKETYKSSAAVGQPPWSLAHIYPLNIASPLNMGVVGYMVFVKELPLFMTFCWNARRS